MPNNTSTLIRLNDREYRMGKDFFRKQTFEKRSHAQAPRVIIRFHPDYEKIFLNYLRAYETLPAAWIGTLHNVNKLSLQLEVAHLGKQIDATSHHLQKAIGIIKQLVDSHLLMMLSRHAT